MTLKTLKDIFDLKTTDKNNVHPYWYSIQTENFMDDIKTEAVKWVKTFGEEINLIKFKHFFNLTEEDLMTNEEINKRENGERGNN